jgi:hypothetical protein
VGKSASVTKTISNTIIQFGGAAHRSVRMDVCPPARELGIVEILSIRKNHHFSHDIIARFVLADTAHLHTKIVEMGQRIRQLEDALAIFQSGVSNEPHPLLSNDLLAVKFGPERGQVQEMSSIPSRPIPDSIDAIGTMTISDQGDGSTGKYFGPSAGSEVSVGNYV